MVTLPEPLYDEVLAVLVASKRVDLVAKLKACQKPRHLTTGEVAELLGVSANTAKNWLEGGFFPGAFRTPGGHWRFPMEAVQEAKVRIETLRQRNADGDLRPAEVDEDDEPPLL
ncbi:MAG: helix-turn-helix domain-containing protein [Sandaracinaceae bacterium]|nr:helix-turn-helix domain-containing protein [Sandaracinaceae bacterium]